MNYKILTKWLPFTFKNNLKYINITNSTASGHLVNIANSTESAHLVNIANSTESGHLVNTANSTESGHFVNIANSTESGHFVNIVQNLLTDQTSCKPIRWIYLSRFSKKSTPIVFLYSLVNIPRQYFWIMEDLPTAPFPTITI